ncbi:MAG: hypothetical protein HYZ48_01900 [Chlamydiales bacterium]|nr:hypothetical protein [Chlamydiales bacterium]
MALDPCTSVIQRITQIEQHIDALEQHPPSQEELVCVSSEMQALNTTASAIDNLPIEAFDTLFVLQERLDKLERNFQVLVPQELGNVDEEWASILRDVDAFSETVKKSPFINHEHFLEREKSLKGRIEQILPRASDTQIEQIFQAQPSFDHLHIEYFKNKLLLLQHGGLSDLKERADKIYELAAGVAEFIGTGLSQADEESSLFLFEEMRGLLQGTVSALEFDEPEAAEGYQLMLDELLTLLPEKGREALLAQQMGASISATMNALNL